MKRAPCECLGGSGGEIVEAFRENHKHVVCRTSPITSSGSLHCISHVKSESRQELPLAKPLSRAFGKLQEILAGAVETKRPALSATTPSRGNHKRVLRSSR